MSVEKPSLDEMIGLCESEAEKRKWFEGAGTFLKGLKTLKREQEQAERARDEAIKAKDAALAEIGAKQAKYEAEMKAGLADLARVTKEKTDASQAALAKARGELSRLEAQITQTNELRELAQGQLDAFRAEEKRETAAITARLEAARAEERDAKVRLSGATVALKG